MCYAATKPRPSPGTKDGDRIRRLFPCLFRAITNMSSRPCHVCFRLAKQTSPDDDYTLGSLRGATRAARALRVMCACRTTPKSPRSKMTAAGEPLARRTAFTPDDSLVAWGGCIEGWEISQNVRTAAAVKSPIWGITADIVQAAVDGGF